MVFEGNKEFLEVAAALSLEHVVLCSLGGLLEEGLLVACRSAPAMSVRV